MKGNLLKTAVVLLVMTVCLLSIREAVLAREEIERVEELFDKYISAVTEREMNEVDVLWSHKKDIEMTHRFQRIGTLNATFEWKGVKNVYEGIFFAQDNRLAVANVVIATKGNRASATFDYSVTLPQWGQRSARSSVLFRVEGGRWLIHNHAWYIQDAAPVAPEEEAALTEMVSAIREAYDKADVVALEAISDVNHVYVSVDSESFEGWAASRDALAGDMKPGDLDLDDTTLLITSDQNAAIAFAEDGDDVIASFRFEKIGGVEWKITVTDLSGEELTFPVDPLSKRMTSWGRVKESSLQ